MKNKVGIITWQGRFNYGNRLQNYATSRIYEKLGYHPVNLVFHREETLARRVKKIIKTLMGRKEVSRESTMSRERLAAFDEFNKFFDFQIIEGIHAEELCEYKYFSVGSDTIWNLGDKPYDDDWRYLQFAAPEKRIALAPSFGSGSLSEKQLRRLANYVKDYKYLSVREESGVDLIRKASGREAIALCDPTLVLGAPEWRRVSNSVLTPSGRYVFAYILGNVADEAQAALNLATEGGRIPTIMLSDKERPGEMPAGPAEFISLVDSSAHVVTDSFHGAIFAILMRKPLTIVHRVEQDPSYSQLFSRLENLTRKLGIENKVFGSGNFNFEEASNYERVSRAIECERAKFLDYLEECIDA